VSLKRIRYPSRESSFLPPNALSFIVAACSGLILYNGQYEGGGDFVSLSLKNARVEFRFDVGSGPVAIISDEILLHAWHTLRFRKRRNTGRRLIFIFMFCIPFAEHVTGLSGFGVSVGNCLSVRPTIMQEEIVKD